jgi:glutamate racemase
MDNRPIFFLDSGIGGLVYYDHFHKLNPDEKAVYVADREHFPYGPRDRGELIAILIDLVDTLYRRFDPKLGVLACNTASVSALAVLRESFPGLPLVGTVPAVKPAVETSKTRRIGVLGTGRTIDDPYIDTLVSRYGPDCTVTGIAAPELVAMVESYLAGAAPEERQAAVTPYIEQFRDAGVDAVVLGCTHFLFLLDEFKTAAGEDISIHDSIAGVCRRIGALLNQRNLQAVHVSPPSDDGSAPEPVKNILAVTGSEDIEPVWQTRADVFKLSLMRLEKEEE